MDAPSRSYNVTAIVLRQHALAENDRILVLFTRELGLKRVVAKGIRKANSRMGGRLEPLRENTLMLSRARGMDIVMQAEGTRRFPAAANDLDRLAAALGAAEVLLAFLEDEDAQPEIYDLYLAFLAVLAPGSHPEVLLSAFELQLMDLVGYRPQLDTCIACDRDMTPDNVYGFNIEGGGAVCSACSTKVPGRTRRMSAGGWQLLVRLLETPLDQLAGVEDDPQRLAGMRRALREYLGFRAERELKAQGMFDWVNPG